jgi:hypothetical protein
MSFGHNNMAYTRASGRVAASSLYAGHLPPGGHPYAY